MPRRADREGQHRTAFDKNRKKIIMTQEYCGICGQFVDKTLKRPNPMAPEVDHIIPIAQGGHPSDIKNLQLVHASCNRIKSDNITPQKPIDKVSNYNLPWSTDWLAYRG